ncbi:MAG: methyl-accepting chemotaxis protein, partial [Spirochaetia bacterium]|nr:methyl-accepting chemotaxis protein [Spirochaetia bacterium]
VIWNRVIDEFFFVPEASKKLGDIFIQTGELLIVPVLLLSVLFVIAGIILSHKVAGPLYRVERVADELAKGNLSVRVRFRKADDIQDLARTLNNMIAGIGEIVSEDKKITEQLSGLALRLKEVTGREKGMKKEIKETIDELNEIAAKLKRTTDKFVL